MQENNESADTKELSSFRDFTTREKSNKGFKMPIPGTKEHLTILGSDSDAFITKRNEIIRELSEQMQGDEEKKLSDEEIDARAHKNRLRQLAVLVVGWSFKEECNEENVLIMLGDAPYIADLVDREAGRTKNFLGKN